MTPETFLPPSLAAKVVVTSTGCWEWVGCITPNGYGHVTFFGKNARVHRITKCLAQGFLTEGLVIDHLCRNRACCNPEHLEEVTYVENAIRGMGPALSVERMREKTHCKKGHPYAGEHVRHKTHTRDGEVRPSRTCWTCTVERQRNGRMRVATKRGYRCDVDLTPEQAWWWACGVLQYRTGTAELVRADDGAWIVVRGKTFRYTQRVIGLPKGGE